MMVISVFKSVANHINAKNKNTDVKPQKLQMRQLQWSVGFTLRYCILYVFGRRFVNKNEVITNYGKWMKNSESWGK